MTFTALIQPAVLRAMAAFVSEDETRIVINGICVDYENGNLSLIATDGRRLAWHRPVWEADKGKNVRFIIPIAQIFYALPNHVSRPPWQLEWDEATSKLVFSGADYVISTRSIDGTFPTWRTVVPDPMPTQFPAHLSVPVNAEFLSDCVTLLDELDEDDGLGRTGVEPVCAGEGQPIIFHNRLTTLLLMPMKRS